jgi:hypothetical protein
MFVCGGGGCQSRCEVHVQSSKMLLHAQQYTAPAVLCMQLYIIASRTATHMLLLLLMWIPRPLRWLPAGELDEGYRITVAARDGRLYNIKSGALSRSVIQLDSQPVGVVSSSCRWQLQLGYHHSREV